jgi:4-hydroxybutyrate CoA-transferase
MTYLTAEEAVERVGSNCWMYVQGMAAAPTALLRALARSPSYGIEIVHLHIEGEAPHLAPGMEGKFHHTALFVGANARAAVQEGRADYVPVFLSEVPALLCSSAMPIKVALIHVSPPDSHGFCSLGVSVEAALAAVRRAEVVIAQVNPRMPRTHGDGFIHESAITAAVAVDEPIHAVAAQVPSPIEQDIGKHVASLIEDGSTLQLGIGAIPNAVLHALEGHRDLGVHTEMFSDNLIDLIQRGCVTNRRKTLDRGSTVASFVLGSQKLYDFVDDNPSVTLRDVEYVNDPENIRRNPKVVAVNSAIEIDLTGQVCADSIGARIYSGVGGQMDFMRAAAVCPGGKPIIALPSRTRKGLSRIVSTLKPGAGVVTTRGHVHFVVTEYGVAELYGRNLRERAKALIAIAHPEDRERLEREARETLCG